ncbi:MAG: drug/metabolite transporter (DMT)-like permease [Gammaproteobacteria bacterium]|jgi:drug/metabolite transporter (DMT)-like permease
MPVQYTLFRVLYNTLLDRNGPAIRKAGIIDYLQLLVAAGMWGGTFLLNEIALADFAPIAIAAYRIMLAALILCLVCYLKGLVPALNIRNMWLILAIGLLNSVVPFSLIGWGQLRIDSSTTAILLATSPFFALLLSHYITRDDRFAWNKLAGLAVGFLGVVALMWQGQAQGGGSLAGMLVVVLAGGCYSLSAILIRKLPEMPSLVLVASTLTVASIILIPVLLWWYPPWEQVHQASSLSALLFLAIGPTATAYVLRVRIVKSSGAVFMSNVGYLIPLFAVFWSWLFLSQKPSVIMWLSLALIFTGLAIGQRKSRR